MATTKDGSGHKQIASNRKAWHEYSVLDRIEAGIALVGTEVKSLRAGRVNFLDAFVSIKDREAWLVKLHISPYDFGNRMNHDPLRRRKLLLHDYEILKLDQKVKEKGLTIVPPPSISPGGVSRSSLVCARERNCMTSGRRLPKKMPDGILSAA